jgi:hypothetical protein
MRQTATVVFCVALFFFAAPFAARAQDQVWTALTVKSGISKRWDAAASLEHRWRNNELDRFVDLRLTRDARKNWAWFYEYRVPLAQTVNPRHTLALEKTWKPRLDGVKLLEATGGLPPGFPCDARVLVVEADDDQIVDPASRTLLRAALPQARVWQRQAAGHALLLPDLPAAVLDWVAHA